MAKHEGECLFSCYNGDSLVTDVIGGIGSINTDAYLTDCGKCSDVGYSCHFECAGCLHGVLADLQYYGSAVLLGQILQV